MHSGVHAKNQNPNQNRNHLSYPADLRTPARPAPAHTRWHEPAALSLPQLVGSVFGAAPAQLRVRMLEHLLRPLGLLSLAAVAQGRFAKIRLRHGRPDAAIRPDDVSGITMADITSLVEHVLQVDDRVVYGLASVLQAEPTLRGVDAAGELIDRLRERPATGWGVEAVQPAAPVWH